MLLLKMNKTLAPLLSLTFLFFFGSSSIAFSEEPKDDVWVVKKTKSVGVIASVNGLVTYGDRLNIRIDKNKCQQGEQWFSFYTTEDNKEILDLKGKTVEIKLNNEVIKAKILSAQKFLMGYTAIFHLDYEPIDSIASSYKDNQNISVELIDTENFKASKYFDVLQNSWSLDNLEPALREVQELCRKGKSYKESSGIPTEFNKLLELAEQGNPEAQFELGVLYAKGEGIQQDSKEAFKWSRLAAEQGHAQAKVIIDSASEKNRK